MDLIYVSVDYPQVSGMPKPQLYPHRRYGLSANARAQREDLVRRRQRGGAA